MTGRVNRFVRRRIVIGENEMKGLMRGLFGVLALGLSASAFAAVDGAVNLPEPGTLGLLAAGIVGVLAVRRFGRK